MTAVVSSSFVDGDPRGILFLDKSIPVASLLAYQNLGWQELLMLSGVEETKPRLWTTVRKQVMTKSNAPTQYATIRDRMYLIQRATIQRPLGEHSKDRLSQAIDLDYMGAAEFEFGAVPRMLRIVQSCFPLYKMYKVANIVATDDQDRKYQLRLWGNFDTESQREAYEHKLLNIWNDTGTIHLKEPARMTGQWCRKRKGSLPKGHLPVDPDFWIDLDTGNMWSFDKRFMSRLPQILAESFRYMDS